MVRIKVKELVKNESLWKFYQWSGIAEKLTNYNDLSKRQITLLGNKIFSLVDWDKIKCEVLADLSDFNGKTYEIKLNQRAIKSAKVLHDKWELENCMWDLLDHNFAGYSGDELPKEVRNFEWDNWWELEKWFNTEMVKHLVLFILMDLTKETKQERKLNDLESVADYFGFDKEDIYLNK